MPIFNKFRPLLAIGFLCSLLFVLPSSALAATSILFGGNADIHWLVSGAATCVPGGGVGAGANVQTQWAAGGNSTFGSLNLGPFNQAGNFPGYG